MSRVTSVTYSHSMTALNPALVNPQLLVWAREQSGFAPEPVAKRVNVKPERLLAWERGETKPTVRQAQALAKLYHRPFGLFFLPQPPALAPLAAEYRRLTAITPGVESPELRLALRTMSYRREATLDLREELSEPIPDFITAAHLAEGPMQVGRRLRELLGINVQEQLGWRDEWQAWRRWREVVEAAGVLVFQFPKVPLAQVRGVSLLNLPLPVIGTVEMVRNSGGVLSAHLTPIISAVFNNEVVIGILGEAGTQTYYTVGVTPPSPLEDAIPQPGPGSGQTPPPFTEGQGGLPPSLTPPQPDMTIKAIGTSDGRRSSEIVSARFLFKTGNPSVVGDNAASFKLDGVTVGAELWYTWDGSDPTNSPLANPAVVGPVFSGDFISFNLGTNNRTFKVRAYKPNFKASDLITKVFSVSNFVANSLSFGFANGEASSDFVAAAGQRFYAPITLSLLAAQPIYSLQFNVVATNLTGDALDAGSLAFQSMLMKPIPGLSGAYEPIPPAFYSFSITPTNFMGTNFFITNSILNSLVVPNADLNLLGVGWLERYTVTNLYDTLAQDLVRYSQAHDTLFVSSGNKVIVGGYSFVVPPSAANGSTYRIKLDRASATSDGISKDVYIEVPTRGSTNGGSINGEKTVTVGSRQYLVGDVAPFRWFNAGDFGNTNLLNNDVLQVFQSASYAVNLPPPGSDFFDAMDASDGSVNDNFTGNIDGIQFGDGQLNVDDIYVVFRRSVDPSLKWFARFWQGGTRQAVEVPNQAPAGAAPSGGKKKSSVAPTGTPTVAVSVDDIVAAAGTTVQVPVRVHITGGLPIRIAMLNVTVEPLDGSPALTQAIDIVPAGGLGTPGLRSSDGLGNVSVAWLNNAAAGVSGDAVVATLSVTVPASAGPSAAYRVRINHFSGSENGFALFRRHLRDGVVTLAARNASSWNDTIPDLWRLRFFGSASSALSGAQLDPDHDGINNLAECRGGTHPMDANSALRLSAKPGAGGFKFSFPTGQGHSYVIEAATDLSGPWTSISTNAGDGIPREFTETTGARRFYRVKAQ